MSLANQWLTALIGQFQEGFVLNGQKPTLYKVQQGMCSYQASAPERPYATYCRIWTGLHESASIGAENKPSVLQKKCTSGAFFCYRVFSAPLPLYASELSHVQDT